LLFQLVDSTDLRTLNLQWYRSQSAFFFIAYLLFSDDDNFLLLVGLVSQEPVLFDRSVRENISYGDNNREEIPLDEIIQAAKDANIHDFIQQLPDVSKSNKNVLGTSDRLVSEGI